MLRDGLLTGVPSTRTLPALTTLLAVPRVLKKRACHNHLSSRIVAAPSACPIPGAEPGPVNRS